MPDPRFFRRAGPFSIADIARRLGAEIAPGAVAHFEISDVSPIDCAGPADVTSFYDRRYVATFASTKAGACFTTQALAAHAPPGCMVLIVKDPRAAFAQAAHAFYPDDRPPVAGDAAFGPGVEICTGAFIDTGAEIGAETRIGANAVIGAGVVIGANCRIGPNVTLSHCLIGDRVIIHPGVQIGQDGFGFVPTAKGLAKIPQLGRVIIGNDVEIGANSCIDRGAADDTVIGAGTKIDNLVQIGHNVRIGENCVLVGQVGIAGSCRIGAGVLIGGQTAVSDHVNVGDGAQIAGKSGVIRDVAPGETVMGYPAKPIRQFWREIASLSRLTRRDK